MTCRNDLQRLKRLEHAGKPVPLPSRLVPPFNAVRKLYKEYVSSGPAPVPLEVPVRVINHVIRSPRACVIRRVNGEDWIYIASRRGAIQLQFSATAPDGLLYALEGLGLEVDIENPKPIAGVARE
jgi:hypothetical protein